MKLFKWLFSKPARARAPKLGDLRIRNGQAEYLRAYKAGGDRYYDEEWVNLVDHAVHSTAGTCPKCAHHGSLKEFENVTRFV